MSMHQTDCNGCGMSVYDLPDVAGDAEAIRETFFDFADDGSLYCNGCARRGHGVFL